MGCSSGMSNSLFFTKINNYRMAIKDVKSMKDKVQNVNFPLNCFLVSVKTIPNLMNIILNNIIERDILPDLKNYILEKNVEIYDDIYVCKNIFGVNNEENEFIIVSNEFIKYMEIKEAKGVTLKIENSQTKVYFENIEDKKMVIKEKSQITYHFIGFEGGTTIEMDNYYLGPYNDINYKDSFMLKCLIDCLVNIDIFKNIFINNDKIIRNRRTNYEISNIFLDIMEKETNNENLRIKRKAFISLYKIIYKGIERVEPKTLFISLMNNLSKEYIPNSIPFLNLIAIRDDIQYICPNCNTRYKLPNNNYYYWKEFKLENIRNFKSAKGEYFINIDIEDCFSYEENSRKKSCFACMNCRNEVHDENKFYKLKNFPNILVIFLDRGNNINTEEQIEFNIEFNRNESILDLTYLSDAKNKIIYDLIGVFSYKKEEEINQVYNTVFCKKSNNEWIFYDKYFEKNIEKMDITIMHIPYMLFYLKK